MELMLRFWDHLLAVDQHFRNDLLEEAAAVLRSCLAGQKVMADIPSDQMNFVAAVWFAEWNALATGSEDPHARRRAWLVRVQ